MIATGLASAFSDKYVALLRERGSTGSKGMGQRAGVIDSGYRGEWFIAITNHNTVPIVITKSIAFIPEQLKNCIIYDYNKAIAQCIILEIPKLETKVLSYDEIKSITSERGIKKLDSTGSIERK